eukprot:3875537-Rhodomonas_salina.1
MVCQVCTLPGTPGTLAHVFSNTANRFEEVTRVPRVPGYPGYLDVGLDWREPYRRVPTVPTVHRLESSIAGHCGTVRVSGRSGQFSGPGLSRESKLPSPSYCLWSASLRLFITLPPPACDRRCFARNPVVLPSQLD